MKTKVNVPKSNPSSLPETTLPETNVSVARLLQIYELQTSPSGKWSPFSQDKLNVVGESHPESNARREQEQLFSAEASGSKNYFQEHEVFFSKINGRGAEGDSTELRLIHDILTLKGLIVGPKWKEYAVAFAARIADALNIVKKRNSFNYYKAPQGLTVQQVLEMMGNCNQLFREHLFDPNVDSEIKKERLIKITGMMYDHTQRIYGGQDRQTIMKRRSYRMHLYASRLKCKGVWKIADIHVRNIKERFDTHSFQYNLISKDEFNTLINRFEQERNSPVSDKSVQAREKRFMPKEGRVLPVGENGTAYDDFITKIFNVTYVKKENGTRFLSSYDPVSKQLDITLPVFFTKGGDSDYTTPFNKKEIAVYKKSIKETWDNKFKIRTVVRTAPGAPAGKQWQNLNDISVRVNLQETENIRDTFLIISNTSRTRGTEKKKQTRYDSRKNYNISYGEDAYEQSLISLLGRNRSLGVGNNEYAASLAPIFGVDFEHQVSKVEFYRRIKGAGVFWFDPKARSMKYIVEGKVFYMNGCKCVFSDDHFHKYDNEHSRWIRAKDPKMAFKLTANNNFMQMKRYFGVGYAMKYGLMDSERRENSIINPDQGRGGGELKKHHYSSFLESMVYAIQQVYGKDTTIIKKKRLFSKAKTVDVNVPNKHTDWTIVD